MVWTKRIFGPGPERLTNVFLNELAGQIEGNGKTPDYFRPGVLYGLKPDFSKAGTVQIEAGACLSAGQNFEFSQDDEDSRTLHIQDAPSGDPVWVYVDADGKLAHTVGLPPGGPGWPDHADQPTLVEKSYCVLGWALYGESAWTEPRDVRHFIRQVPNDAILVVGDVNAGAEFEDIQQAMDYLEACDIAGRRVPRHIVVTQDQAVTRQLQVRVPAVRIEASPTGADPQLESAKIALTWEFGGSMEEYAGAVAWMEDTSLFDLYGQPDFTLDGFHIARSGTPAAGVVLNPGSGLRMVRCRIVGQGSSPPDPLLFFTVISATSEVLERVRIEDNTCSGLIQGLIWFVGTVVGWDLWAPSTGCLRHSLVKRNDITVQAELGDWGELWDWLHKGDNVPVIDCGLNDAQARANRVEDNVVVGGRASIRIGPRSTARNNTIRDVALYGIWADTPSPPAMNEGSLIFGGSEISGNDITMLDITEETAGSPVPPESLWWRAAVRLELSNCHVVGNRLDLNRQVCCGITEGYVQALSSDPLLAIPKVGILPPRVGDNEYAHGWVLLSEGTPGNGLRVGNDDWFDKNLNGGSVRYRPDRIYYLSPASFVQEPRTLRIFVVADIIGESGYMAAGETFDSHTQSEEFSAKVDENGLTGIFDTFRVPPAGGQLIKGNDISNFPEEETTFWTTGEDEGEFTGPSYSPLLDRIVAGRDWPGNQSIVTKYPSTGTTDAEYTLTSALAAPPEVVENTAFICTEDGKVDCIRLTDGQHLWVSPYDTGNTVSASPTYYKISGGNDFLFVADHAGEVHCLDPADGSKNWTFGTGSPIRTKPCAVLDDTDVVKVIAVVGSDDGKVRCVDNGVLRWEFQTGGKVESSAAALDDYVYIGSDDGKVYCLDALTDIGSEREKWAFQTGGPVKSSPTVDTEGDPAGLVCVGSDDRKLYCLVASGTDKGSLQWSVKTGDKVRSKAVVKNGIAYFGCYDKYVRGIDIDTGTETYSNLTAAPVEEPVIDAGYGRVSTTLTNGCLTAMKDDQESIALAPPMMSFGVALLSKHNRVKGNRIVSVSTGIFVLDQSNISENVIYSAWLGISASRRNTICGNQIWWFRAFSLTAWFTKIDLFYPYGPFFPRVRVVSGILASKENVLVDNTVAALPVENIAEPVSVTVGIRLSSVPMLMIGQPTSFAEGSDPEALWVFVSYGGNVVSGNKVDQAMSLDSESVYFTQILFIIGIYSDAGPLGSVPPGLGSQEYDVFTYQENVDPAYWGFNVLTGNTVTRCGVGCMVTCPDIIQGCLIHDILADGISVTLSKIGPRIENCHVSMVGQQALTTSTNVEQVTVRDCVLMRPRDPLVYDPDWPKGEPAIIAAAGSDCVGVSLSDCFIANHDGIGIDWKDDYGCCVGCFFYTMAPTASWDPHGSPDINNDRYAAIVFDQLLSNPATQANLVVGAHMAHSLAKVEGGGGLAEEGPIQYAGPNDCPPIKDGTRWTNRVYWESCYYLTVESE